MPLYQNLVICAFVLFQNVGLFMCSDDTQGIVALCISLPNISMHTFLSHSGSFEMNEDELEVLYR